MESEKPEESKKSIFKLNEMKKLELSDLCVQEMDAREMLERNGGILGLLTLPVAGWIAGFAYQKILNEIKN